MSEPASAPSSVDLFLDRRAELPDDQARAEFDRCLVTQLLPLVSGRAGSVSIARALHCLDRRRLVEAVADPEPLVRASAVYPEPVVDPLRRRRGLVDLVWAPVRRWLP